MSFQVFFVVFSIFHFFQRTLEIKLHRKKSGTIKERKSFQWMFFFHMFYFWGAIAEFFILRKTVSPWVSCIGLIIFFSALLLRRWAIQSLGEYWSVKVEVRKEQPLIRTGPYRFCRHPNYVAIILEVIGFCLLANAYITLAISLVGYSIVIHNRIKLEELVMIKKYGNKYERYIQTTDILIPSSKYFRHHFKKAKAVK